MDDFRNYYYDIMEAKRWWPLTTFLEIIEKMPYFAYKYYQFYSASENQSTMKAFLTMVNSNTILLFTNKTYTRRARTSSFVQSKEKNLLKASFIPTKICKNSDIKVSHLYLWRYSYPRSKLIAYLYDKSNN